MSLTCSDKYAGHPIVISQKTYNAYVHTALERCVDLHIAYIDPRVYAGSMEFNFLCGLRDLMPHRILSAEVYIEVTFRQSDPFKLSNNSFP